MFQSHRSLTTLTASQRRSLVRIGVVLLLLTCPAIADSAVVPPAERPVGDLPLGVYWPWECTESVAKNAGMDRWAFTGKTCALLKDNGVDSIWVVNISAQDLKLLLKITRPLGLKLVPCLSEIEPKNCRGTMGLDPAAKDFKARALEYYARRIPEIAREMGNDRDGVLAWVLCDEPTEVFLDLMEPMRELFAKTDPDRPALAVTMWPQTPDLIRETRLTTFCVDLYAFFGPNSPNGPNTPATSRDFYSNNLQQMVKNAGRDDRVGWVVPMCFCDIWGPWEMRPDGFETALPGAYVHWRTPTDAEMRWQIWEGLRLGAKGVFFYVLFGDTQGDPHAKPSDEPTIQAVLVKKATPVGYSSLLDARGNPTPQLSEMSSLFRKLAPHKALLRRLAPSGTPWITAEGGAQVGSLIDSSTSDRYAIVVNPDFDATRTVTLCIAAGTQDLMDMLTGKSLTLKKAGDSLTAEIGLKAGDGVLLKIRP